MRALELSAYGDNSNLNLVDRNKPEARGNQVLIKVHYAGLNPVDFKTRSGMLKPILPFKLPHIVGNELAGVVEFVGAAVTRFKSGDRVCVRVNKKRMGAFAEYAVVDEDIIAPAPHNVDLKVAAGIPLVSLTAYQVLHDYARIQPGDRVLIHAGAGSVGRVAIQLAKLAGAWVITTTSDRGLSIVEALGADEVINYHQQRFEDVAADIDLVIDCVGKDTLARSFQTVKQGGRVCSIAGLPEPRTAGDLNAGMAIKALFWLLSLKLRRLARRHKVDYRYLFMRPDGKQLDEICRLCEARKLMFDIDREFSLEDYAQAYDYLESGQAFGKLVLKIA